MLNPLLASARLRLGRVPCKIGNAAARPFLVLQSPHVSMEFSRGKTHLQGVFWCFDSTWVLNFSASFSSLLSSPRFPARRSRKRPLLLAFRKRLHWLVTLRLSPWKLRTGSPTSSRSTPLPPRATSRPPR